MHRVLTILLITIVLILPSSAKTYCILTGVSHYQKEGMSLQLSTDDTKRLAQRYKETGAVVRTLTGEHATSTNIIKSIRMLQKRCNKEDQVVFFFSGHGWYNSILTYDISNMLYYSDLFYELRQIDCSNIVVIVDACYSGTLFSTKDNEGKEHINCDLEANVGNNDKFIIMSASRNNETSKESMMVKAGFFSNALIKGLYGSADENNNGEITVGELFRYIYTDVTARISNQHPNLITNTEKNMDVVLMKLPTVSTQQE